MYCLGLPDPNPTFEHKWINSFPDPSSTVYLSIAKAASALDLPRQLELSETTMASSHRQNESLAANWKCLLACLLIAMGRMLLFHLVAKHCEADAGEAFQYGVDFGLIAGIQAMVGFDEVSCTSRLLMIRILSPPPGLRPQRSAVPYRMEPESSHSTADLVFHDHRCRHRLWLCW